MPGIGQAQVSIVKNLFDGLIKRAKTSSTQQKFLAYGGGGNILANLVLGGGNEKLGFIGKFGRLIDFALDLAAIGSIFCAPLAFYVACGYGLKAAWHGLNGLWCLTQRDLSGAMANFVTAGITIASIAPITKWKGIVNKAIKVRPLKGAELKEFAIEPLLKNAPKDTIFGKDVIEVMGKNKARLNGNDIVKGEVEKYGEGFVKTFSGQKDKAEKTLAEHINKVHGEGTVPVKKPEVTAPSNKPASENHLFEKHHIGSTKTKLSELQELAKKEADEAKALLKQKEEELKALEEQLKRKEIEEAKVKEAKDKLEEVRKTTNEKATAHKEAEKKLTKFEAEAKRLEEIEHDLKIAEERQAQLKQAGEIANKAEADTIALNKQFKAEAAAFNRNLPGDRVIYYASEQVRIIEDYNKTLITGRFSPRRTFRLCVQESYGVGDARTARTWYDKVTSWCRTTGNKLKAPGKVTEAGKEAVTKEVKEKVGPLTKIFRTFRKAWEDADPNKVAKAANNVHPNIPAAPAPVPVKTRIWTPGFEYPNPRAPLKEVPPFTTREPHLTHRQFTDQKIMPGAWVSPGTKAEINGTTIVKG